MINPSRQQSFNAVRARVVAERISWPWSVPGGDPNIQDLTCSGIQHRDSDAKVGLSYQRNVSLEVLARGQLNRAPRSEIRDSGKTHRRESVQLTVRRDVLWIRIRQLLRHYLVRAGTKISKTEFSSGIRLGHGHGTPVIGALAHLLLEQLHIHSLGGLVVGSKYMAVDDCFRRE